MTHTVQHHSAQRNAGPQASELLRGLGALATAAALLVLPPILLTQLVGSPLPAHLPTGTQLTHLLTAPLDDHALITLLGGLTWLLWAHLAGSVLVETRRQLPLRHLPVPARTAALSPQRGRGLLAVNRRLAHRLVAAALVVLPITASTALPAAQTTFLTRAAAASVQMPLSSTVAQGATHNTPLADAIVGANDSPTAARPSTAATARATIESASLKRYVVCPPHGRHYDSLWDIATRHLGDGRRFDEIYQLNRGRTQPDGKALTRASLIHPGWELLMPPDATGADLLPARPAPQPPPAPISPGHSTAPQVAPAPAQVPPSVPHPVTFPAHDLPAVAAPPQRPASGLETAPTHAAPAPHQPATPHTRDAAPVEPGQRVPVGVPLGLGIGALGALAALQRARRIAHRRRPEGSRPAPVPAPLARIEAGLRREAKSVGNVASTVRLACALASAAAGDQLRIRAVIAHDGGAVDLILTEPHPQRIPAPFTPTAGGWQLPAHAAGYTFGADELPDPLPALLAVGRAGDADHFHDLRPEGLVGVTGPSGDLDAFLATAAGALAGAPWAGQLRVLTPPALANELGSLEHLDPVADLHAFLPELLAVTDPLPSLEPTGSACSADDTRQVFVLVGWAAEHIPPLLSAAALDLHRPVALIVRGPHQQAEAVWRLVDRELHRPDQPPTRPPLRTAAAAGVAQLIEHTRTAAPVHVDEETYQQLRTQAPPQPPPADVFDDTSADRPRSTAADPTNELAADEPAAEAPIDGEDDVPTPGAGPIEIRVLGPVGIDGAPPPRRTPVLQILIYLAVHRRGVDAGQLATALWPEAAAAGQTLRNRVREARSVVRGHITAGPKWQLTEQIGCDWQHFQALAAGTDADQRAALELVRGRPFEDMADTEWIHLEGLATEIEAAVVDLALAVGARALENGDPAAAFAAARSGLRASPYEERLYRLAMRAADAEGATGKIRAVMRELRSILDADIEPDDSIDPETIDLYRKLTDTRAHDAGSLAD